MTTFYLFIQWARPVWLLVILASAVSVGLLLTVLSLVHSWLADQVFILDDDAEGAVPPGDRHARFEIPVRVQSGDFL